MKATTVRFENETVDELDEIAHDQRVDRSEVIRHAVNAALDHDEIDLEGPDWASARRKRERMKKMAQPDWWREGFHQRVRRMVNDLADSSPPWHPDGVERLLTKWVAYEVREVLWPDDDDRQQWALDVIDDEIERYREEYDAADVSPDGPVYFDADDLDIDLLNDLVDPADADIPSIDDLVEQASVLLDSRHGTSGYVEAESPAEVRSKLENRKNVTTSMAQAAVEQALDQNDRDDQESDDADAVAAQGGVADD